MMGVSERSDRLSLGYPAWFMAFALRLPVVHKPPPALFFFFFPKRAETFCASRLFHTHFVGYLLVAQVLVKMKCQHLLLDFRTFFDDLIHHIVCLFQSDK